MSSLQLRQRAEAMIEELISILDLLDGDADFEAEPLEPDVGGTCVLIAGRPVNDLEYDEADREPWLSWIEREDQSKPHHGFMADMDYEGSAPEWEAPHAA